MDPAKYEYQSEVARRYVAEGITKGRAEGRAEGKVELVLKLLARCFGPLPQGAEERVRAASIEELDTFAERVLSAESLSTFSRRAEFVSFICGAAQLAFPRTVVIVENKATGLTASSRSF
jgi:hypothetical protein